MRPRRRAGGVESPDSMGAMPFMEAPDSGAATQALEEVAASKAKPEVVGVDQSPCMAPFNKVRCAGLAVLGATHEQLVRKARRNQELQVSESLTRVGKEMDPELRSRMLFLQRQSSEEERNAPPKERHTGEQRRIKPVLRTKSEPGTAKEARFANPHALASRCNELPGHPDGLGAKRKESFRERRVRASAPPVGRPAPALHKQARAQTRAEPRGRSRRHVSSCKGTRHVSL